MAGKIRVWGATSKTAGCLHSCLHSFTFQEFKSNRVSYLQAHAGDSKSGALHWACGFKSHLRHHPSLVKPPRNSLVLRHGVLPSLPTAACASLHSPEISAGSALSGFDSPAAPPPLPLRLRASPSKSPVGKHRSEE